MSEITKNALVSGAISTGGNVVSSLLNQAFAGLNAKRSFKFSKKMLDYENEINQQNWQRENARQDWLLQNQQRLQKQALENAGYSTADPNGTGVSTASINDLNSPSGGQFRSDAQQGSYLPTYQDLLQTKLVNAQVENLYADAEKKGQEAREKEINNFIQENYGEDIAKAQLDKLQQESKKLISETLYVDAHRLNEIDLTEAQVRDINKRLDIDLEKLPLQLKLLAAEVDTQVSQQKLNKAQAAQAYANVKKIGEEINKIKSDTKLNDKQLEIFGAQLQNLRAEGLLIKHKDNYQIEVNAMKRFERQVQEELGPLWYKSKEVVSTLIPLGFIGAAMSHVSAKGTPTTTVRKYERVGSADIPIFDFGQ